MVQIADSNHISFTQELCHLYEESAKKRGTGIAKRDPEYIKEKILQENEELIVQMIFKMVRLIFLQNQLE